MKKCSLLIICFVLVTSVISAASPIKSILNKYKDDKNCTILTFNSSFLNLKSGGKEENLIKKFDFLRIVAFEGESDFKDDIKRAKLDKYYAELMRIKEDSNEVKMYLLEEGNVIKEFLMVITGKDDALIQIKGNFSKSDLSDIGNSLDIDKLSHLKKLEELEK